MDRDKLIEGRMKQLKTLSSMKNKTEKQVYDAAVRWVDKNHLDARGYTELFTDKDDIKYVKELKNKYLDSYSIQTVSDENTLSSLLFYEVMLRKIQAQIINITSKPTKIGNIRLPKDLFSISDNMTAKISQLKTELGINRKDQKEDIVKYIDTLKKKAKIWQKENAAQRTRICPHCKKLINFVIKMDQYEGLKHTMYKGRWIHNEHLIKLYLDKKITDVDVAKVLGTSKEYTNWLVNKFYKKEESDGKKKTAEKKTN